MNGALAGIRILAAAFLLTALVPAAMAGTIKLESVHDVARTMDRLESAAKAGGARIVARTNLARVMQERGYVIPDEEEMIFSAPVTGDAARQEAIRQLALQLRARAYVMDGTVWLTCEDIDTIATAKGLERGDPIVVELNAVLTRMMEQAAGD